jgi:hypothetical protein
MFNCKKLLSLALAATMAAALAVPAFAADATESTTNRSLKIDGTYQAVDIAVVVPSTGTVVINPYKLPYKIGTGATADVEVSSRIVTKPLAIKNQSKTDLYINATATATVKNNLTLATAAIEPETDTKNEAFIYLAFAEDSTLAGDSTAVTDKKIVDAYGAVTWPTYDANSKKMCVLKNGATQTIEKAATLTGAEMNTDGSFKAYKAGSIAYVGLTGECAQEPKTAWTAKDGLSVTIAFTFTPATTTSNSGSNGQSGQGGTSD